MYQGYSYIQTLEIALDKSSKNFSLTCEQEESRRLRTDLLFLQEENGELQSQLIEREERVDILEEDYEEQTAVLEQLNVSMNNLHVELRGRLKEVDRLKVRTRYYVKSKLIQKAEVNSLQASAKQSAMVLDEKLALAREVSIIRPEIEHLRAQQDANANILSEKLALQRELQTIQVELENEKRALQKALARDEGRSAKDMKSEAVLEAYRLELTKEKGLREKLERESNKIKGQFELHNSSNEAKLEEYRAKLKSAKEQIKKTRSELDEARKANERLQQGQKFPAAGRGKRSFAYMDADGTIGTPDGFPPKKTTQLLLGERSGFGLTPFLKQSTKLIVETPVDRGQEEEKLENEEPACTDVESVPAKEKKISAAQVKTGSRHKQTRANRTIKQKKVDHVEDTKEDDERLEAPADETRILIQQEIQAKNSVPKKKRRVLGAGSGKTLFDDDDNLTGKIDSRGGLDDFKFATMPKKIVLAPKGITALGARSKAGALSGFGAFSPLKKDRKK